MPKEAKPFVTPSAPHPSRPELVRIRMSGLSLEILSLPRLAKVPRRPRALRRSGSRVRNRIGKGIEKGVGKRLERWSEKWSEKGVGKMVGKISGKTPGKKIN